GATETATGTGGDVADLRLGFIGCGRHARANLYPSIALAGGRVHSIAARTLDSARQAAQRFGAQQAHAGHRSLLDQGTGEGGLDAVFVSVAPEDHAAVVIDCLRAGLHVFVEKPLGMTGDEAALVAEVAQQTGRHVMVAFMKRFAPSYAKVRDAMADTDSFGETMSFASTFGFSSWTPDLDTAGFLRLAAIHVVDLVSALFGEVENVAGHQRSRGADINLVFAMRCASGVVGTMNLVAAPAWGREHEELTVTGRTGFVTASDLDRVLLHIERPRSGAPRWHRLDEETVVFQAAASTGSGGEADLYRRGFAGEVAHFLQCVRDGAAPTPSANDNVRTTVLVDRMLAAVS
ncbi:MAG TPA: Gfo/Idh/MocA family oxidoreductase, partial [Ilumatobacteraceae bacterium]